uniref:DISC1 scaffold protein n=1 Tax=Sinocyclocheilus rhinocerous TaxID=307959 RepID=A0A673M4C5_9TELE
MSSYKAHFTVYHHDLRHLIGNLFSTGAVSPTAAAGSYRWGSFRRPGYMCSEPCGSSTNENTQKSASKLPSSPSERWLKEVFKRDDGQDSSETHRLCDAKENSPMPSRNVFNSSFSFIQQSLETSDLLDVSTNTSASTQSEGDRLKSETSHSGALEPHTALVVNHLSQSEISTVPISQSEHEVFSLSNSPCSIGQPKSILMDRELWLADLDVQILSSMTSYAKESIQDSDSGSLDTEVTSSFSIDSTDSTSASSVTSGYDSTTPSSDQSRDGLIKKYEDVLQDCLQNNRTNTKIESIMMKLQRLQHKAVLDDDYDTGQTFTCSVLGSGSSQSRFPTREKLLEEKQRIQEMCDLQRRLQELREQSRAVEEHLEPVLRACDPAQLRLMARALEDMISSEHRAQISVSPPAEIVRLQEQERALRLSTKEATAKVVMSQRLGSRLRRKVSESETQLLTLHDAKLAAISGNDFSSAKELKAEIRSAYGERDRLEGLERKLKTLRTYLASTLRLSLAHNLSHPGTKTQTSRALC